MTSTDMIKTAVNSLEDKKAFDIRILDIKKVSSITDYFIIASGSNKNQLQAMCDSVEEDMHKSGFNLKNREGYAQGGWILLDYYDIIIHIFTDEMRQFYDLDHTWRDGISLSGEDLG